MTIKMNKTYYYDRSNCLSVLEDDYFELKYTIFNETTYTCDKESIDYIDIDDYELSVLININEYTFNYLTYKIPKW